MKIGIVGYQGAGKSTLFHWLTGVEPDLSLAHATQMATCTIVDPRVEPLCGIYQPKKITQVPCSTCTFGLRSTSVRCNLNFR